MTGRLSEAMPTSNRTTAQRLDVELELRPHGDAVTHRELKDQQAEVFRSLAERGAVPVSNRGVVDGVLMSPERFAELARDAREAQALRTSTPWMLAAVASGAAVPVDVMQGLGVEVPFDWKRLDDFLQAFPLVPTHDEEGRPLAAMPDAVPQIAVEDDSEWPGSRTIRRSQDRDQPGPNRG